jgi:hypothetical protein
MFPELRRMTVALSVALSIAACEGEDDDPLPTALDAGRNVIGESPVEFAPSEGGVGMGTFDDDLPFTFVVLAQGTLDNAGETNCGQFSADDDDLELTLYGTLQPGEWTIQDGVAEGAGVAQLRFAGRSWISGTVTVEAGSESRGAEVSGSITAVSDEDEAFTMDFSTLMHGCGRE